jgi:hypothetical protein
MSLRILAVAAALAALALAGCADPRGGHDRSPSPTSTGVTLDGLVFAFGPGAKNVLDTTRGTFTKDMILASPLTVPMLLTDDETARIAEKMDEIDFFSYPESYVTPDVGDGAWGEPHDTYFFSVTTRRGTKVVEWEDGLFNDDERAAALRSLARLIVGIVEAKPEYQRLPPPEGGYL